MPCRSICSTTDCTDGLRRSLSEWNGRKDNSCEESDAREFLRDVTDQCITMIATSFEEGSVTSGEASETLKAGSMEDSICYVIKRDLQDFMVEKYYKLKRRGFYLKDGLEEYKFDDPDTEKSVVGFCPFFLDGNLPLPRMKSSFRPIADDEKSLLNPFARFSLRDDMNILPGANDEAHLAYRMYTETTGQLEGQAFEAIVASFAIESRSVSCFCCHNVDTLFWSGGSSSSFRDLFCISCHSCYEVKSKRDKDAIDKVFKHKTLKAGSFRGWCKERFPDRMRGKDYIVLVGREHRLDLSNVAWTSGKRHWLVEIADIVSVLPCLHPMSFVDAKEKQKYISVKTTLTLGERGAWFKIPWKELDFRGLLRIAFEEVFPDQWDRVSLYKKASVEKTKLYARKSYGRPSPLHQAKRSPALHRRRFPTRSAGKTGRRANAGEGYDLNKHIQALRLYSSDDGDSYMFDDEDEDDIATKYGKQIEKYEKYQSTGYSRRKR